MCAIQLVFAPCSTRPTPVGLGLLAAPGVTRAWATSKRPVVTGIYARGLRSASTACLARFRVAPGKLGWSCGAPRRRAWIPVVLAHTLSTRQGMAAKAGYSRKQWGSTSEPASLLAAPPASGRLPPASRPPPADVPPPGARPDGSRLPPRGEGGPSAGRYYEPHGQQPQH